MRESLASILPRRDPERGTRILGVLNLTPDSFYDGGANLDAADAVRRAEVMVAAGADALDLGAESSRPGADPVPEQEELARLLPVLERAVELGVPVSVDTVKSDVARRALAEGASIVNDISGLTFDPRMAEICAEAGAAVIVMHMRGTPRDMQTRTDYDDVVEESLRFLEAGMARAVRAGVAEERVLIDPGIGFAKTADHNLEILRRLSEYQSLGRPVVIGASRKSFLGSFGGDGPDDRLEATLAVSALAIAGGASVLRVHDVAENVRVARVTEAVLGSVTPAPEREPAEEPC